jgi:cell fate (sporulation/competence/biofilm development) regulator YmcA (YheA/YmcA/DUF963 family)
LADRDVLGIPYLDDFQRNLKFAAHLVRYLVWTMNATVESHNILGLKTPTDPTSNEKNF